MTSAQSIRTFLETGESVIDDALAQSVDVAEATGRGGGEGRLFVTNRRLIHWTDGAPAPSFQISRDDVARAEIHRIIVPGMREFRVVFNDSVRGTDRAVFWVAKRAARRLRSALSSS